MKLTSKVACKNAHEQITGEQCAREINLILPGLSAFCGAWIRRSLVSWIG